MPAEHLTAGFFGKIPAAGDFVTRDLPADFVRRWDRWLARHLAPLLDGSSETGYPPLRFCVGEAVGGPASGVVLASADRAGRAFPLTLATLTWVSPGDSSEPWFGALEDAGVAAVDGELDAEGLRAKLAALPPPPEARDVPAGGMVFGTAAGDALAVDPERPRDALLQLIAAGAGAA